MSLSCQGDNKLWPMDVGYIVLEMIFFAFIDIIVYFTCKEVCKSWPQLCYVFMSLVESQKMFDYIVRVVKLKSLLTCSCSVNSIVTLPYTLTQFKMHVCTFISEHNRRNIKLNTIDILYFFLNEHEKLTLESYKFI